MANAAGKPVSTATAVTSSASTTLWPAASSTGLLASSAAYQRSDRPGGGNVRYSPDEKLSSVTTASGDSRNR